MKIRNWNSKNYPTSLLLFLLLLVLLLLLLVVVLAILSSFLGFSLLESFAFVLTFGFLCCFIIKLVCGRGLSLVLSALLMMNSLSREIDKSRFKTKYPT